MQLFVPEIGTKIQLVSDWTFSLFIEERNKSLFENITQEHNKVLDEHKKEIDRQTMEVFRARNEYCLTAPSHPNFPAIKNNYLDKSAELSKIVRKKFSFDITIPLDTVLIVDRIYIRKNQSEFSSLTFIIDSSPDKNFAPTGVRKGFNAKGKRRFWAKLEDCNRIEFEVFDA